MARTVEAGIAWLSLDRADIVCDECDGQIEHGELYTACKGCDDAYICSQCTEAAARHCASCGASGFCLSCVMDDDDGAMACRACGASGPHCTRDAVKASGAVSGAEASSSEGADAGMEMHAASASQEAVSCRCGGCN